MNWSKATKTQLLQIALNERCPIDFKYRACSELVRRERSKPTMMELFDFGWDTLDIAEALGINYTSVHSTIGGLIRRGVYS